MLLPVMDPSKVIIPVIHQIWIGSEPPQWVLDLWKVWDEFAYAGMVDIRRWTDNNATHTLSWRLGEKYGLKAVEISDFLRLEVLALQGGVYMDSDTYPLRRFPEFLGERQAWFANGQDTVKSGMPTISNAMIGAPKGHPFLSDVWEHGVRALARGVRNTFDIVGPTAIRRVADRQLFRPDAVEITPVWAFPAYRSADKRREESLGRQLTHEELLERFPGAKVIHRSATSWVKDQPTFIGEFPRLGGGKC